MAENHPTTGPRPPLPVWVLLADLKEALVRLLEAYPALAALVDRILEEIWAEIARPVPLICRIPHRVLRMEHLVPLTSRQGMPSGFARHHDYLGDRIILNEAGWPLVKDWHKGQAERAADEHYPIAIYSPALEEWLAIWALRHSPQPKAPMAARAQPVVPAPVISNSPSFTNNPPSPPAPAAAPEQEGSPAEVSAPLAAPAPAPKTDPAQSPPQPPPTNATDADLDRCIKALAAKTDDGKTNRDAVRKEGPPWLLERGIRTTASALADRLKADIHRDRRRPPFVRKDRRPRSPK